MSNNQLIIREVRSDLAAWLTENDPENLEVEMSRFWMIAKKLI